MRSLADPVDDPFVNPVEVAPGGKAEVSPGRESGVVAPFRDTGIDAAAAFLETLDGGATPSPFPPRPTMKLPGSRFAAAPILAALLCAGSLPRAAAQTTPSASTTEAALRSRLDALAAEVAALKAEVDALRRERAQAAASAPAPSAATAAVAAAPPPEALRSEPATVLSSYGEINVNRPRDNSQARADLRRFVIGFQHRFDDKTKVVTELEVEHAVSSAADPGEVEIEQAFVERQLAADWLLRAGVFLMPVGLLNENHEPTAYYGVERNFVETAIIPTTWREGGVQFAGNLDNGMTLQFGLSTGFDLTKWDANSNDGRESPLGSIHQEMAQARAGDLSLFGAANWRGVPGLLLGGSVFSGNATQGQAPASSRVTLWDLHARWTPGNWDLAALYARGTISNTAALNAPLAGSPTLIPAAFGGGYLQGAYTLWRRGDYALTPFARWEQYNTAASYADLGPGLTPAPGVAERVFTLGANLMVGSGVVFKADVQKFRSSRDLDRFDLGMGWSF